MGLLDQLTPYIINGAAAQRPAPQISADLSGVGAQLDPSALDGTAAQANLPPSLWQRLQGGFDKFQTGYDKFNNGVGQAMQSPLFNLGLGLISAAQPFADPGKAIQGAMGNMLTQQQQRQQIQMQNLYFQALQDPQMQAAMGGGLMPQQPGPTGGLLAPQPSPAGPGASPGAPAGAPPGAVPQSPSPGPDPMQLYQQGVQLSGSMIPQFRERGAALMKEAQAILENDPQYVQRKAAASSVLSADQYQIQNAPTEAARQAATIKFLTDAGMVHVANNNGAVTTLGGLTPGQVGAAGVNPEQGLGYSNGQEYALPGAASAQGSLAQARAGGQEAGKAPYDMEEVTDQQGNRYLVPKSQLLAPGTAGGARPAGAPASPALSSVGPQTEHALASRGQQASNYVTQLQDSADSATTSNYALDNVIAASRGATLGPGAPAREAVLKGFTALAQAVNPNFKPPTELSSYQELDKYGNQLGFATARSMGSREAAQIVQMAIASNPNKTLTLQSFSFIASSMKAMNNYVIAKNSAIQAAEQQSPGSAQQAASIWTSKVDPRAWDLALDPNMAATVASKLGPDKVAASMPFMSSEDAVAAFRNLPASMRASVLAKLPASAKQELAAGLRQ